MAPLPTASNPTRAYATAVAASLLTAALAAPLLGRVDLANIVMLFLLTVFLVAWKLGRGPAVFAAFLCVALFDFFFVPPQLSFAVSDAQYLITFAVMLAVGLITAHLTTGLRQQADLAGAREQAARRLYELARDLAGALSAEQVGERLDEHCRAAGYRVAMHLQNGNDPPPAPLPAAIDATLARTAMHARAPVESGPLSAAGQAALYLPLLAPMRVRGVVAVAPAARGEALTASDREFLETVASLAAIAVERLHYVDVAQQNHIQVVSERLRSSILAALSHDIRTPLTALVGLADSLAMTRAGLDDDARATAADIRDQARAMSHHVSNLLDMARLHAGRVELRREWQLFEDVIGASLQLLRPALGERPVTVTLAPDLPLLEFDAVLLERVICNLVENAAKYAPAGSPIEISAFVDGAQACIRVRDHGPGFPNESLARMFEMFERGTAESKTPGVGLGLAICRAIVDAHHGSIGAANAADGGACVTLCLPRGTPPTVEAEAPEEGEPR